MSMADRVILLSGGRIEQNGAPVDLYETPANIFVARFIGTPPMNLLRLDKAGGEAVVAGTEGPGVAPIEWAGGMLGVRPEHVLLTRDGAFTARVESVEYLGADSILLCRIGEQLLTARVSGRVGVSGGDSVHLSWARGASHFFDAATGVRLATEPIHQGATMFA